MSQKRKHVFSKLWSHFGPFGDQVVHYHPCIEHDGCAVVVVGNGRNCDGKFKTHKRRSL